MGLGKGDCWIQLLLVAFSPLISATAGTQLEVMSAPNLLRVGTEENIFVEIQDVENIDQTNNTIVEIFALNHPTKSKVLNSTKVTLHDKNYFQAFGTLQVPPEDLSKDPNVKQYVCLQAHFPGRILEKVVLVSFQSGFIFIQTDRTIYTPNSNVRYRIFVLSSEMKPIDEDTTVIIDIMSPGDIVIKSDTFSATSGMYTGTYELGEIVSIGLWKVVAKFNSNPQVSFPAEFEVKEYVLPSFEVKLSAPPESPFFYVDSSGMNITIEATYVFGEKLGGSAYAVFGLLFEGDRQSLPSSLQRVPIEKGRGVVTLKKEHITAHYPNILDLVGMSIYVSVTVLTESGSEMVEAELRNIKIVTSPYTIRFKKTPKYFKPRLSFDVSVEVLNPDDTPAKDVQVLVKPGPMAGSTSHNGIAKLTINTVATSALTITATTNAPMLSDDRQASASMTAYAYSSQSGSYLHINVDNTEVKLGDNMRIIFYLSSNENMKNDITYLILSKGQLVKHKRFKINLLKQISQMVEITKEMMPSFRIVAYYHIGSNELVSDSVWVDVNKSCMGTLKLELSTSASSYEPRKSFGLKVTGDPEAKVGLLAVDKSVYFLNNKHRLTQKKIWDTVEQYDTGCTAGGGSDGMSVIYDAGLLFETSLLSGTNYRTERKCPSSSRRKRARTLMEVRATLVSEYQDKVQKECCLDGLRDIPVSYTCERRSKYILDGSACVTAFLRCCKEVEKLQLQRKEDVLLLARSQDDEYFIERDEVHSRTNFPESWLWSDVTLSCPAGRNNCKTGSWGENIPLPDTITTWQLTGISMSSTHGICVSDPLEVIVWKPFFIDLRLPYSAVRDEQLEVKAILHNYNPESITDSLVKSRINGSINYSKLFRSSGSKAIPDHHTTATLLHQSHFLVVQTGSTCLLQLLKTLFSHFNLALPVRVDIKEDAGVCSAAYKKKWFRQEITIGARTTRSVPFIIIPIKDGEVPIEIKAIVKNSYYGDGIKKMLRVVPQGVLVKRKRSVPLDPSRKGGTQVETINSEIPATDMVPNTPMNTIISISGRELLSPLLENAISGDSMSTLIQEPSGCGEQNMAAMTLPVIATLYLDETNQWETVGFEKRNLAIKHISTGYENELTFRKSDGSFAIFPQSQSTTWLTAYVAKVFAMSFNLVQVTQSVVCDAIKFLILNAQQPDGMFIEIGSMYDEGMIGDVGGVDSDVSMTAFCLIAMQQSRTSCSGTVNSIPSSIQKAARYLMWRLPSVVNPYAVALASCALAEENQLNKGILFKFASPDRSHWPVPRGHIYTLEATAYALLALVKVEAFQEAKPVARWLSREQKVGGGYGSTQATIMVYQAVAQYWTKVKEPPYDLNVDVMITGRSLIDKYNFNNGNHYATRTSKFKGINKDVTVTATGTGEAMFNMVSLYYTMPKVQKSDCEKFDLTVQLFPEKMEENMMVYKLTIDVLFKNRDKNASMSILDIGLPTGYTFEKSDLDALASGHASLISKYETNKVLSDKGSLIIYLRKISNEIPEEISFRIRQQMKVGFLQPAAVSVYEYYDRKHCVKFYRPERQSGELLRLCRGSECVCAEENCSMQKKGQINDVDRTAKACETTATTRIDFVYKVKVDDLTDSLTTDTYRMRILEAIKEGSRDVAPQGKFRTFLSYRHCREALDLRPSKTYLIMGSSSDIYTDGTSFQYVLGENTWIEYWPTSGECQREYRATCIGIEDLVEQLEIFGCQM